jgi:hypothetical protein
MAFLRIVIPPQLFVLRLIPRVEPEGMLFGKPVSTPIGVEDMLFGIMC